MFKEVYFQLNSGLNDNFMTNLTGLQMQMQRMEMQMQHAKYGNLEHKENMNERLVKLN